MKRVFLTALLALLATAALFVIVPAGMILFSPPTDAAATEKPVTLTWLDAGMDTPPAPPAQAAAASSPTDIAEAPPMNLEPLPMADVSLDALPIVAISLPSVVEGLAGLDSGSGPLRASAYPLASLNPSYPSAARSRGVEGTVVVEFLVDVNGRTKDIAIVEADPEGVFEGAVLRAVRQWRFSPALHEDGHHVSTPFRQIVRFTLSSTPQ